ncbi:MAG TPA: IMP dehydrogenase [Candidatus Nitrosocosmicus sp.]|uniref:IMP dehydrogenase n=1 Tax=Candidatus Nitrosocosmicus agrestis TaxID=2563600 RepID=UPI00122E2227|nr:IMP dehydrogenase [Candidatus Nitrosocosmicus sp. SS]KAA2280824.1 IMP dehydrogenase [Candidatus Nitrosocosmicus sp. SS]KAF0868909.1 IMP dehydrogenase [Candidatus Nitrosocosmicus sp. SS]HET6589770.1 IMP dehydrogenase [Candidatus Nitrosocosmicus sp.]
MYFKEGLTFDDVLLVPKKSPIVSRSQTNLKTRLSSNVYLNIPIISANMDSVTESRMAIALAREGGIGIIHRFMTIQEQVEQVLKVKRSESVVIEQPYTISPDSKIKEANSIMAANGISGLLVKDHNNKLCGILTRRDTVFERNPDTRVSDLMTKDVVSAKIGTNIEQAKEILHKHKIEKLPVINEAGEIHGLITGKDILKMEEFPNASKDKKGRLLVGAAVGVKGDYLERTEALLSNGADIIVVDIAHGHSDNALNTVKLIKKAFPTCELVAGNVATGKGTEDLIKAGVDAVKVGVGSGSICITRIVTGSGVPQLTAVIDSVKMAKKYDIPVISDGGTRTSGDLTKALAAGSSSVMVGSLFGGTDESPGKTLVKNGKKYKMYRGMASFYAALGRKYRENAESPSEDEDLNDYVPEGVEAMVPYKGSVIDIIRQLVGGLRSGLSYCGANTIAEMQENAEFIKITLAGYKESHPHDVDVI